MMTNMICIGTIMAVRPLVAPATRRAALKTRILHLASGEKSLRGLLPVARPSSVRHGVDA